LFCADLQPPNARKSIPKKGRYIFFASEFISFILVYSIKITLLQLK